MSNTIEADGVEACACRDILQAVRDGKVGAVRHFLRVRDGRTPLHLAVSFALPEVVSRLLSNGAEVDEKTPAGYTSLHIAAESGNSSVIDLLVAAGAQLETRSRTNGMTPLHCCADKGHQTIVKQLLAARAAVNATSEKGRRTSLHWSSASGHADVVRLLLEAGASEEIKDSQGNTACDIARKKGHHEVVECFAQVRPLPSDEAFLRIQELEKRLEEAKEREQSFKDEITQLKAELKKTKEELTKSKMEVLQTEDKSEDKTERKEHVTPPARGVRKSLTQQIVDASRSKAQYDLKDPHSLADFLRDANIQLVRAPFLAELVRQKRPLPRRQEAPETALVTHQEVQEWASGNRNATICSISHAWETMEHPDPCRFQLGHIVNRLSLSEVARDCDFWVFYDYVSLFQFQRFSDAENRSFSAAMQNMHVMYAHECTVTFRMQTLTPDSLWQAVKDQRELIPVYDAETQSVIPKALNDLKSNRNLYGDRGWCRAEVEWSSLRTVNLQHQRICPADADEVKSGDGRSCRVPMTPQKFEATMKDSKFTHKADSEIVISLQAKVFQEKVSACEFLVLEGVPAAQMAALADVLPFYKCLKSLKLSDFECNQEEAMAFGEALASTKVERLELQQPRRECGIFMGKAIVKALKLNSSLTFVNPEYTTFIEKEDSKAVMEALRRNAYSKARLPFDAPVRLQALATALDANNAFEMANISLEDEKIGDLTEALAKMLNVNTSVQSLNIGSMGISEEGAQVLVEALESNRTLKTLAVNHEVAEVLRPVERSKQERGDNFEVVDFQPFQKDQEAAEKYPDEHGSPGICGAAIDGKVAAVRGFVRRDANAVNLRDRYGRTALNCAASNPSQPVEVVRVLLAAKASMEAKDDHGNRPLHLAARWGYMEILQLLIAANASLEAKGNGFSPLHVAAKHGQIPSVRLFLAANASLEAKSDLGETALMAAAEEGEVQICQELLKAGAAVNVQADRGGQTALMLAAGRGKVQICQELLKAGAAVDAQATVGQTALMLAAERGDVEMAKILLEANASVEAKDTFGQTPLHFAARKGHKAVVEALVAANASPHIQDRERKTALDAANASDQGEGKAAIVKILEAAQGR